MSDLRTQILALANLLNRRTGSVPTVDVAWQLRQLAGPAPAGTPGFAPSLEGWLLGNVSTRDGDQLGPSAARAMARELLTIVRPWLAAPTGDPASEPADGGKSDCPREAMVIRDFLTAQHGYVAICAPCKWNGPVHDLYADAKVDVEAHNRPATDPVPATPASLAVCPGGRHTFPSHQLGQRTWQCDCGQVKYAVSDQSAPGAPQAPAEPPCTAPDERAIPVGDQLCGQVHDGLTCVHPRQGGLNGCWGHYGPEEDPQAHYRCDARWHVAGQNPCPRCEPIPGRTLPSALRTPLAVLSGLAAREDAATPDGYGDDLTAGFLRADLDTGSCSCHPTTVVIHQSGTYCGDAQYERLLTVVEETAEDMSAAVHTVLAGLVPGGEADPTTDTEEE